MLSKLRLIKKEVGPLHEVRSSEKSRKRAQ